jgi:hypothetical protein
VPRLVVTINATKMVRMARRERSRSTLTKASRFSGFKRKFMRMKSFNFSCCPILAVVVDGGILSSRSDF